MYTTQSKDGCNKIGSYKDFTDQKEDYLFNKLLQGNKSSIDFILSTPLGIAVTERYHIINLLFNKEVQSLNLERQPEYKLLDYRSKTFGQSHSIEIEVLHELTSQKLNRWIKKFNTIKEDSDHMSDYLLAMTMTRYLDNSLKTGLEDCTTPAEIFGKLKTKMEQLDPNIDNSENSDYLRNPSIKDYGSISGYTKKVIDLLDLLFSKNKKITEIREEIGFFIFFNGLTSIVQKEIISQKIYNFIEARNHLLDIERTHIKIFENERATSPVMTFERLISYVNDNLNKSKKYFEDPKNFKVSVGSNSSSASAGSKKKKKWKNGEKKEETKDKVSKLKIDCIQKLEPTVQEHLDKHLYVNGRIGDINLKMLIDTGATRSVMSLRTFSRLGLAYTQSTVARCAFANGIEEKYLGETIAHVYIEEINTFLDIEFMVLPELVDDEILIGMNSLAKEGIIIDTRSRRLEIKNLGFDKTVIEEVDKVSDDIWEKSEVLLNKGDTKGKVIVNSDSESKDNDEAENGELARAKEIVQDKIQIVDKSYKESCAKTDRVSLKLKEFVSFKTKGYDVPAYKKEKITDHLDELLAKGYIVPSKSEIVSPAFAIGKKNTTDIRLVVNYKKLNDHLCEDSYPFPNIHNQLLELKKGRYFSQIDLKQGYYQLELEPKARKLTSFIIDNKHYEWTVLPFGIKTAPRIFQRTMDHVFGDLKFVQIYLDDIVIISDSIEEHKRQVIEVLNRIQDRNFRINWGKSNFFKKEITYLGHIISEESVRPELSIINNMDMNVTPNSKKDVQKIVGTLNWYRKFIPNMSTKIFKITEKLKTTGRKIIWDDEDKKILQDIKEELNKSEGLVLVQEDEDIVVETDASQVGIGGVIYQSKGVIGYYSKKFMPAEMNYTTGEKEVLAIIRTLEHFRLILLGRRLIIKTDHKNLTFDSDPIRSRIQRWKAILNQYDYRIEYIKGEKNIVADQLSRINLIKIKLPNLNNPGILNSQLKYEVDKKKGAIFDGSISVYKDQKQKIIIPKEIAYKFINSIHKKLRHPGEKHLRNIIRKFYAIKNLEEKVKEVVKDCKKCQTCKYRSTNYGKIENKIDIEDKNDMFATDIYGPFDINEYIHENDCDKAYIVYVTDLFTRYTTPKIIYSISADVVTEAIRDLISKMKVPKKLLSDQGTQFCSNEFKSLMNTLGIKHVKTSAYNPQSNGIAERINQTTSKTLRIYKGKKLKKVLKYISEAINCNYHRVIKTSPEIAYLNCSKIYPDPKYYIYSDNKKIRENNLMARKKNLEEINKNRKEYVFKINDKILLKVKAGNKLDNPFEGPYRITKIINPNTLNIDYNDKEMQVNIKNIIPFVSKSLGKGGQS